MDHCYEKVDNLQREKFTMMININEWKYVN